MQKLNKIQKINLELKNYANRIKAQTNLLNNKDESVNFISNNQNNIKQNKKLLGILTEEADLSNNPKVKALQQASHTEWTGNNLNNNLTLSKGKKNSNKTIKRLNLNSKGRGSALLNKKPMYLISKKIHRHIRSLVKFNSDLAQNSTISYNFFNNNKKFNLNSILNNSFLNLGNIISKPVLSFSPNLITINLFYYVLESEKNYNLISESDNLEYLCSFLSNKFKKAVKFELIRLHHPALESKILANTIGFISNNKKVRFRSIITSLYNNTQIIKLNDNKEESNLNYCRPTALIGIKVRLGGRILSQKIVPRFTTFNKQKGAFARIKSDFTTQSRFTNKSRRGAFSYTVTIAHKSF